MFIYRLFVLSLFGIILAIMTDVSVDLSGTLSTPVTVDNIGSKYANFSKTLPSYKEFVKTCKENIRPWSQFANTSNFKVPPNIPRFFKRAVNNVKYFQGNYVIISIVLMALTSPLLLLSVAASLIACYMLSLRNSEKKIAVNGKEITLNQQYGIVGLCSLPLYYWAGVGQAVFWTIGASCLVTSLHAGFYNIEEVLSPEDQLNILIQV